MDKTQNGMLGHSPTLAQFTDPVVPTHWVGPPLPGASPDQQILDKGIGPQFRNRGPVSLPLRAPAAGCRLDERRGLKQ